MEEFLPRFDPVDAIDQASEFAPELFDERFREFANLV
jgi:hypothetical protein